jgi:glutathione S-transferase
MVRRNLFARVDRTSGVVGLRAIAVAHSTEVRLGANARGMKLYFTPTSPFVRKVTALAHERGIFDRLELVMLRPSPLETDAELSRTNPLNKIPALVLDDGTAIYDSSVICEYLDSLDGGPLLLPAIGPERWRALRLAALGDGILEAGIVAFYERTRRPPEFQWQPWIDGQLQKVRQGLDALEREAPDFREGEVNVGLITIAAAIGWLVFREVIDPLEGRPALRRWYDVFVARPSMQATLPRA